MPTAITAADYRALAELRYRIRQFLSGTDAVARKAGLEPQQYLLMLAVRGIPESMQATIGWLAGRLALKHNTTVELINRLEKHGYVHRERTGEDRRRVRVSLLPRGAKSVEQVAQRRISELREDGVALVNALHAVIGTKVAPRKQLIRKRNKPLAKSARKSAGDNRE
jgi:DNA-binding MarR family transcriptional regulator